MDKRKVKNIIKPIIEECVKEMFFEKGFLSNMIQEVMDAQGKNVLKEDSPYEKHLKPRQHKDSGIKRNPDAYGDIEVAKETVSETKKASSEYKKYGALKDLDPSNPGVSIDKLLEGMNFKIFND